MRALTTISLLMLFLALAGNVFATPVHLWSHNYGDSDVQYTDALFTDAAGNVFLVGSFYGSINIATPYTSLGRRDAIVAKWDPNGNPLWSKRVGFKSVDTGWAGTTDTGGNVIMVGSTGPHPDERDAFIARYAPDGIQQWIKYFIASGPDSVAYVQVVACDLTKHILVAGAFNGSINLGGSTLGGGDQDHDIFVAEFDAGGSHIWSKKFHGANGLEVDGIAVDTNGQPALVGGFAGQVDFGGGPLTSTSSFDLFLVKLDTNGNHLWSHRYGETGDFGARSLAMDPTGRIAITGQMWGNMNFGGGVLTPITAPDIFLAVFNSAGSHLWSKRFGDADQDRGDWVSFASNNDLILSASAKGPGAIDFGGGAMTLTNTIYSTCVGRFFPNNGVLRWQKRFSGNSDVFGRACEAHGQFILGGAYFGTLNLGGSDLISAGDEDWFIARFSDQLTAAGPTLVRASLAQNSPNPFNPSTTIEYTLVATTRAVIEIVDAAGRVVTRIDEGMQPAGAHQTMWNGRDSHGTYVASGVYFYRLQGMPDVAARKMVLLK